MATLHALDLPDDLYAKLDKQAFAQNISINALIITLLKKALLTEEQQTEEERAFDLIRAMSLIF